MGRVLVAALLGTIVGIVFPGPQSQTAVAVTTSDSDWFSNTPRRVISVCVESSPDDVEIPQARVLLDRVIVHWEATGGLDGNPAVDLTHDKPCKPETDVRVKKEASSTRIARTGTGNRAIFFNDSLAFWDGIDLRGASEYSYEGVLAHEIGHTLGISHTGDGAWTFDGGALPTMTQCGSAEDTEWMDTLQQDDWGAAVNIGTHSTSKTPFWSANPGFERGTSYWYRNSSSITTSSSYANTGALGLRIPAIDGYAYITSVYDPWHPINFNVDTMSTDPDLHVRTDFRHNLSSTTGGVAVQYDWWYLEYEQSAFYDCKTDAPSSFGVHSGLTTALLCGDHGTAWYTCDGSVSVENSTDDDATVFRAFIKSKSSFHLYVDRAGAYGATSW